MSPKLQTFCQRLFSTVILLALLGAAVWWNSPIGYAVLIALFCNLTTWEWFRMLKGSGANRALVLIGGIAYPWIMTLALMLGRTGSTLTGTLAVSLLVAYTLIAFLCELIRMDYRGRSGADALKSMGLTLLSFIYPGWLFCFAFGPLTTYRIPLLLWLILFTKMSDIWAYCCGVLLGRRFIKRPFSPAVSPKKSWEGIIGSYIITLTIGFFLAKVMWTSVTLSETLRHILTYLLIGTVLFILSVAGDLAGSLIKRGVAVKDSGSLLPGIGGIFDLIDSPAFTIAFASAVVPPLISLFL
ncbi:MAG: phosphatidate cytidylyltransferase [Akkermansia sp.]